MRRKKSSVDKPRIEPRADDSLSMPRRIDTTRWSDKVSELAHRGFRLESLLDFVDLLLEGKVMPSFQPEQSTTNDVVRQAVIPLSRGIVEDAAGQALASVWSGGESMLASRMVTHNWGNNFMCLVAAIVADAVGESEYKEILAQVVTREGLSAMREHARAMGVLDDTYWACAFSVNQHENICSDFGPQPPETSAHYAEWWTKCHDTVSQEHFCTCDCGAPKYFNDEPDECELNKFDDMMRYMAQRQPSFRHIVAIDEHFNVFMRAWCVAEIVEGSALNLSQRMVIHSQESFDRHYNDLKHLDVRACRASRLADKMEILGKIKDIDVFNEYLQWLIFGTDGLFDEFLDWESRLLMVSKIASRTPSARSNRDSGSTSTDLTASASTDLRPGVASTGSTSTGLADIV
jgi:hypothetical protein